MIKYCYILFSITLLSSFINQGDNGIEIEWVYNLEGDYSFKEKWQYADYVYKNDYGQLVCDGICDPETDNMRDKSGRILEDSLSRYYQLVDTTHLYHSIECESNSYEWAGTDNIEINRTDNNTTECYTLCNAATHSSLHITIKNNHCVPEIKLTSIANTGHPICYKYKNGYIKINKQLWDKGIMKAEFDFNFSDHENPKKDLYWKGKIYSKIN